MFYHDIKEHMSPSALDQWLHNRSGFIKSYFMGEKGATSAAMRGGTKIHALIEGGLIKAKHVYEHAEQPIKVEVPNSNFSFMGIPDSYETQIIHERAAFVDYKSGKANNWEEKLEGDIKMKATAWLVWLQTGRPAEVHGSIEFIQTTWNEGTREIVPIDGKETEIIERIYIREELEEFTQVIIKAMKDVNAFYEKWLKSSGDFVSMTDIESAVQLRKLIADSEEQLGEIEERIMSQMDFGGEETHKTPYGTFSIRESRTYDYPGTLEFVLDGKERMSLEKADRVAAGAKAARDNFQLVNEPKSVKRSIQFRPTKEK